jgi:hypothetical protein
MLAATGTAEFTLALGVAVVMVGLGTLLVGLHRRR